MSTFALHHDATAGWQVDYTLSGSGPSTGTAPVVATASGFTATDAPAGWSCGSGEFTSTQFQLTVDCTTGTATIAAWCEVHDSGMEGQCNGQDPGCQPSGVAPSCAPIIGASATTVECVDGSGMVTKDGG